MEAVAPSALLSDGSTLAEGPGVDVGVGPVLLRTVSCGAAVSARVRVMLFVMGEAGGETRGRCCCGGWASDVCLLDGCGGRSTRLKSRAEEAKAGETGGVWVAARGRV